MNQPNLLVTALLLATLGCAPAVKPSVPAATTGPNSQGATKTGATTAGSELSAAEILKKLLANYRSAQIYQDEGLVHLQFRQQGQVIEHRWPSAVKFERPSKLALDSFQASVRSDGNKLLARLDDPPTNHLDGQVLVRTLKENLRLTDLASDPLLYETISGQIRRQPIQLELLLESAGLASAFSTDVACKRLADETFDKKPCYRVEVPSPGGAFLFWIDSEELILRRLDYPVMALLPELANDPAVEGLTLSAELLGAKFGGTITPEAFTMALTTENKEMRSFVLPPQPLPSKLFGKVPGEFFFTSVTEGGPALQTQADLKGKVAVLAWFRNHPACVATLQQIEQTRQEFAKNDQVAFWAISTDDTATSNLDLQKLLQSWQVELPIVRDLEAFGDKVFHIEVQPTVIVLGGEGEVEIVQPGGNPLLSNQLGVIIERLLKGESIAKEILATAATERADYDNLVATGGPAPTAPIEIAEAVIRQRSQPQNITLTERWANRELKKPGNIYLLDSESTAPRLLAFEGFRSIAELTLDGKIVARHPLELPEGFAATYLRWVQFPNGERRYLVSAPQAGQLFLFGDKWEPMGVYPSLPGGPPLKIMDIFTSHAPSENPLAFVGYGDLVGLRVITWDGKLAWRSRACPTVVSVAAVADQTPLQLADSPTVLVTADTGALMSLSQAKPDGSFVAVKGWPLGKLASADFGPATQACYLGISADSRGELFALGIDKQLNPRWRFPLPTGIHQRPIEPITSGRLLDGAAGFWLIAGPDGSIHLLSEDGKIHDSFHYGATLGGIAAGMVGGQGMIFASSDEEITAFQLK